MFTELIRRHSNHLTVAAVIGFVLFTVATLQLPTELGKGRIVLTGLFQVGVLAVFFAVLWKVNKFVAFFLVLAVVSRTVPTITLESQAALKMVLFGLGWYYFVYQYGDKEQLMDVICVIAFVHFMATFIQFFKIPSVWVGTVCGLTYNPNEGSAMFALCFPAFLREGELRIFNTSLPYKAYLPMVILGLFMTPSFGGVAAMAAGMVFYGAMFNVWLLVPVGIGLALFWLFCDSPSAGARWVVWVNTLKMIFSGHITSTTGQEFLIPFSWEWGCGLGHWKTVSYKLFSAKIQLLPGNDLVWTRLHNSFLNGFIEMGVGFIVVTGGYLVGQIRKYKQVIPFTALIVIIVCCSTNSMFRMNAMNAMLAITWLAILEIRSE